MRSFADWRLRSFSVEVDRNKPGDNPELLILACTKDREP
jgi:hypothetical protein